MILESKENEIKELQNKLEIVTREHESCQKQAESSRDQIKSVKLESAEQEDGDCCEIIEEFSLLEIKTEETKRITERRNVFKYQMKSNIQVNWKIFTNKI